MASGGGAAALSPRRRSSPFSSGGGVEAGSGLPTAALLLFPMDAERGGHGSLGGGGAQGLQSQAPRAGSGLFHFSCFFI